MYQCRHFTDDEFICRGYRDGEGCCDGLPDGGMSEELEEKLDDLRDEVGLIHVSCGYRCPTHNATIPGAATHSRHLTGQAADIYSDDLTVDQLADKAVEHGFTGVERNYDLDYVHVDVGRDETYFWVHTGGNDYECDEHGNY